MIARAMSSHTKWMGRLKIAVAVCAWLALAWMAWHGRDDLRRAYEMPWHAMWLVALVALAPVNWTLEAVRWKLLCDGLERQSLVAAVRGVLLGYAGRVFTPFGVGEYPSRALYLSEGNRAKGVALVLVGSYAQTLVIAVAGVVAMGTSFPVWTLAAVVALTMGYFLLPRLTRQWSNVTFLRAVADLGARRLACVLGVGVARYVVMCLQMYCAFLAFGSTAGWTEGLQDVSIYYLFVTFTPSLGVTDLATRGLLGTMVSGEVAAMAGMTAWIVNQALAALIGSVWVLPRRKEARTERGVWLNNKILK